MQCVSAIARQAADQGWNKSVALGPSAQAFLPAVEAPPESMKPAMSGRWASPCNAAPKSCKNRRAVAVQRLKAGASG